MELNVVSVEVEKSKRRPVMKKPKAGGKQRWLQYDGSYGGGEYVAGGYKGPQWQVRMEGF